MSDFTELISILEDISFKNPLLKVEINVEFFIRIKLSVKGVYQGKNIFENHELPFSQEEIQFLNKSLSKKYFHG